MIIYKDLVTGDELFSDTFKVKVVDDILYEVEGKNVTVKKDEIDDKFIGGNASAEGVDDDGAAEAGTVSGIDIVLTHRLVETGFKNKKEYQIHLKGFFKKITDHLTESNPGRVAEFKAKAQTVVKDTILANFSELQFFMGESCNPDGMHVLVIWRGETPILWVFKDGLIEEKV